MLAAGLLGRNILILLRFTLWNPELLSPTKPSLVRFSGPVRSSEPATIVQVAHRVTVLPGRIESGWWRWWSHARCKATPRDAVPAPTPLHPRNRVKGSRAPDVRRALTECG